MWTALVAAPLMLAAAAPARAPAHSSVQVLMDVQNGSTLAISYFPAYVYNPRWAALFGHGHGTGSRLKAGQGTAHGAPPPLAQRPVLSYSRPPPVVHHTFVGKCLSIEYCRTTVCQF